MGVITVRLNDSISGFVDVLSSETDKSKSEVVRELITKAIREEKTNFWLRKYKNHEVTLRKVAEELNLPYWTVFELAAQTQTYGTAELENDLKQIGE